jgi:hypothetical protein
MDTFRRVTLCHAGLSEIFCNLASATANKYEMRLGSSSSESSHGTNYRSELTCSWLPGTWAWLSSSVGSDLDFSVVKALGLGSLLPITPMVPRDWHGLGYGYTIPYPS